MSRGEPDPGQSDDWSSASIFGQVIAEPRTFTEVDPVPLSFFDDPEAENPWSPPTYFGPRRHRPGVPAGQIISSSAAGLVEAVDEVPELAALEEEGADDEGTPDSRPAREGCSRAARRWRSRAWSAGSPASSATSPWSPPWVSVAVGNAYNSANSFPNMVYELLLGGVLSSVLIPLIVHAQHHDADRRVALHAAAAVDRDGDARRHDVDRRAGRSVDRGRGRRPGRATLTHQHLRHAAAARDLLLRAGRAVHGRPQHPRRLRAGRLGAGRQQRHHPHHRRGVPHSART